MGSEDTVLLESWGIRDFPGYLDYAKESSGLPLAMQTAHAARDYGQGPCTILSLPLEYFVLFFWGGARLICLRVFSGITPGSVYGTIYGTRVQYEPCTINHGQLYARQAP